MREHVLIGYNIALRSKELRHIADLVLHHHESWNGDGYPKKLKGEEIPLECRVLSVVDAYDAMTHHRPYHEGISQEAAFDELRNKSGIQFDPEVVGIFIQLMNEVPILANVRNAPEAAHEAGITSRRAVAMGGNGARHDKLN
jgi:HD-GYP domain-containing protein (c-di-GMP phosphodiesterase class II)